MAWEAIMDEESALNVEDIITLTSLIFANQAGFSHELGRPTSIGYYRPVATPWQAS